jgi:hypothetical protein
VRKEQISTQLSKEDFALAYTHNEPRSQVGHGLDIKELKANSWQKHEIFLLPEASRPVTGAEQARA